MCKVMVGGSGRVTERFWPGRGRINNVWCTKMLFSPQNNSTPPPPQQNLNFCLPLFVMILILSQRALLGTSGRLSGGDPAEVNPAAALIQKQQLLSSLKKFVR